SIRRDPAVTDAAPALSLCATSNTARRDRDHAKADAWPGAGVAAPSAGQQQRRTGRTAGRVLVRRGRLAAGSDDRCDAKRRSWTLQEPQIERCEHQDNSDVYY